MKIRTEKVIDVSDWDELVVKTYGRPYSFQQQDGCKERQRVRITVPSNNRDDFENDTVPEISNDDEMGVSFAAWLARDPNDYTEMWWERNFYPEVQMVANDLHAKGLLEAGEIQ
jgi:hypothetical protein